MADSVPSAPAYVQPPEPLTAAWLSAALRAAGVLNDHTVTHVAVDAIGAFNSRTRRLDVRYSPGAEAPPPAQLILKQPIDRDWAREAGRAEVAFYQFVAALDRHPPAIVPCAAAAFDEASGDSYLLLHDLSATHATPRSREQQIGLVEGVPPEPMVAQAVEALARHHAYWWNHPALHGGRFTVGHWSRDAERARLYRERRRSSWIRLLAASTRALSPDDHALFANVLGLLEQHWACYLEPRFREHTHLTLIHGDSYWVNFLCPRPAMKGEAYLVDWQSPSVDLAAYDLVNLLATFWTPQQRREGGRERRALERYYHTLIANGVCGYSWEKLLDDYRAGLIFWLLVPVQDAADGADERYWRPKLACLVAAFNDWRCNDLLVDRR